MNPFIKNKTMFKIEKILQKKVQNSPKQFKEKA